MAKVPMANEALSAGLRSTLERPASDLAADVVCRRPSKESCGPPDVISRQSSSDALCDHRDEICRAVSSPAVFAEDSSRCGYPGEVSRAPVDSKHLTEESCRDPDKVLRNFKDSKHRAKLASNSPEEVSEQVFSLCGQLKLSDARLRAGALSALGHLAAACGSAAAWGGADVQHTAATAVARRLEDADPEVREAAAWALVDFDVHELARHAKALASQLDDSDDGVRCACVTALGRIAHNIVAIQSQLADDRKYLGYVYQATFTHVARRLNDPEVDVRVAAIEALAGLEPQLLARYAAAATPCLRDSDVRVRTGTVRLLCKLEPSDLEEHSAGIAGILEGGNSLLHYAAEAGSLSVVKQLASKHRHTLLHARNLNQDTPLHLAARHGCLSICAHLVQLGALVKARNSRRQTPAELAHAGGHFSVVHFLEARENLTTIRGGIGDALEPALSDLRPVIGVEWYTIAMPGVVGLVGGIHSLLAVTVGDPAGAQHTYVIEKAARARGEDAFATDTEQYKNGVHISHWLDVVANVDGHPIYTLERRDINDSGALSSDPLERARSILRHDTDDPRLCMPMLRDVAVEIGPYDVATCNCHHAALAVFNRCAQVSKQVATIPNEYLTWTAWMMRLAGFDVATSTSVRSGPADSVASVSVATSS